MDWSWMIYDMKEKSKLPDLTMPTTYSWYVWFAPLPPAVLLQKSFLGP